MTTGRRFRTCARSVVSAVLFLLIFFAAAVQAASYIYDANGRLRAVTSSPGASSEYIYDALGNLLAINSVSSSQLTVFAFTPNHGPTGSLVTIYGQGFSTTAGANAVSFNGAAAATVTPVSATQLTAVVPAGATTGPISVQVGANTGTSVDNFYVSTDSGGMAPTIASFTPLVANAGSAISVTGNHFLTTAGATLAGVNPYTSAVTPPSDTQLSFMVAAQAGTGPVTVTTPYGSAQSSAVLVVPPSTISASSVVATSALTVNGTAQAMTINSANTFTVATFQASAGQWLSLQWSSYSTTPSGNSINVWVYDSNNVLVVNDSVAPYNLSMHLPELRGGSYAVFMSSGSATAQFSVALQSDMSVLMDGPSVAVPTSIPGQSQRLLYFANVGDSFGIGISNLVLTNNTFYNANLITYKPDGALWLVDGATDLGSSILCVPVGCDINVYHAPQTGIYSFVLMPGTGGNMTMSYSANVVHDSVTPLTANVPSAVSLTQGQTGVFTFSGTAGSAGTLKVESVSPGDSANKGQLTLLAPDGSLISSATTSVEDGYVFDLASLPQTGTYTLLVDPNSGLATTLQVTLVPSASATITVDGVAQNFAATAAGQSGYFNFNANVGDNIEVGIGNLVVTPSTYVSADVYKPDGTRLSAPADCFPSGCSLNLSNLPQTGLYAVVVHGNYSSPVQISFSATVSHQWVASLTTNTATNVSLRSGQSGLFTFTGTAGASMALQLTGVETTPSGQSLTLTVLNPDGTTFKTTSGVTGGYTFDLANPPQTGTYALLAQATNAAAAAMKVTLIPSSSAAVAIDGAAVAVPTTQAGQYVYFDFTANSGDNIGVGISNLAINLSGHAVYVYVYKPDGNVLTWTGNCFAPGCSLSYSNLPQSGVYGVIVQPYSDPTLTMSFSATVSHDLVTPLAANTTASVSLKAGQGGRFTFAGTAGTAVGLQITGLTGGSYAETFTVLNPDGTTLASEQASVSNIAGYTFNLAQLPQTGTYTLVAQNVSGVAVPMQVTLIPSASAAVAVDGAANTVPTTQAGQYVYFDFTANAGDNIGVGISNLVMNLSGDWVYVEVYRPDGNLLLYTGSCAAPGCSLSYSNLPLSGVYGVIVHPYNDPTLTMSFNATVSHDLVTSLTANAATSVNLRSGQNGQFTFSGTAGAQAQLQVTNIGTTPSGQTLMLTLLNPDGTTWKTAPNVSGSYTFNLTNEPQTGTYTLLAQTRNAASVAMTLTLSTPTSGGDPYWPDVTVLLNLEGANGSTTITNDVAGGPAFAVVGGASLSTAQYPFGTSSLSNPNGTGLQTMVTPLSPGTSAATVEGFFYATTMSSGYASLAAQSTYAGIFLKNGALNVYLNADIITAVTAASPNAWHHFEADFSQPGGSGTTTIYLFLDGNLVGTDTTAHAIPAGAGWYFGTDNNADNFTGYLKSLRITDGVMRHTANFTPPNALLPNHW